MFTPVLELQGTWEEIASQVPDYQNTPLRVTIQVKSRLSPSEAEHDLKILREVFEATRNIESKPDTCDWLREGRAGGMFPDASAE